MDLVGFHFVFPDSIHTVEQTSHFNTWCNLEDVPTFPQILPDAVSLHLPFKGSVWALGANMV